jgi:hypothetical protein
MQGYMYMYMVLCRFSKDTEAVLVGCAFQEEV